MKERNFDAVAAGHRSRAKKYGVPGKGNFTGKELEALLESLDHRCAECRELKSLDIHHKQPLRDGGDNTIQNITALCYRCHGRAHVELNRVKANSDPGFTPVSEVARMVATSSTQVLSVIKKAEKAGRSGIFIPAVRGTRFPTRVSRAFVLEMRDNYRRDLERIVGGAGGTITWNDEKPK